ncbi:MAG: hypothetical protein IKD69_02825 [Solobacterium sp.]|nr:hypothetical protein [Solobacterium sp.]
MKETIPVLNYDFIGLREWLMTKAKQGYALSGITKDTAEFSPADPETIHYHFSYPQVSEPCPEAHEPAAVFGRLQIEKTETETGQDDAGNTELLLRKKLTAYGICAVLLGLVYIPSWFGANTIKRLADYGILAMALYAALLILLAWMAVQIVVFFHDHHLVITGRYLKKNILKSVSEKAGKWIIAACAVFGVMMIGASASNASIYTRADRLDITEDVDPPFAGMQDFGTGASKVEYSSFLAEEMDIQMLNTYRQWSSPVVKDAWDWAEDGRIDGKGFFALIRYYDAVNEDVAHKLYLSLGGMTNIPEPGLSSLPLKITTRADLGCDECCILQQDTMPKLIIRKGTRVLQATVNYDDGDWMKVLADSISEQ